LELLKSQSELCRNLIRRMGISSEDLAAAIEVTKGTIENIKARKNGMAVM
jgi:plasmid maintenance system antidote protein VapI